MRKLILFAFILLFWSCEMQPREELAASPETTEQIQGPYQVTSVSKTAIQSLGKKLEKQIGYNVIESAQMRQFSDFTFDLEASQLTTDSLQRRTYSIPFLEKGDKFSTFNLVLVADSVDNVIEQYVLQYEFDSMQFQTFEETQDLLTSGVTLKRFPFSSFFNDSNPGFEERCDGVFDSNGDPVTCDQVTINYGSGSGGSGDGGSVTIAPGSGGGTGPTNCEFSVVLVPCSCENHIDPNQCSCQSGGPYWLVTMSCNDAQMRKSLLSGVSNMTCMDCSISDFGAPAFTLTRDATQIDNLLSNYPLSNWHMAYLSNNSAFSSPFRSTLYSDSNLNQEAAMFTLSAAMNGALIGNFNDPFILSVEGLIANSEADLTYDPIQWLFQHYFEGRYAVLKALNPSWSQEKLFYESAKESVHLVLDGIGLIEGLGTPADLLSAGLYYLEGDRVNGNLSLVAATPVIGLWSTTVKGALKLKGIIPGTTKRITHVWAKDGDKILFGGTRLRIAMGITDPTKHAHHILPLQQANHPVIQKAAKAQNNPFHIDEIDNGVAVDAWQNTTHPQYNQRIFVILENYKDEYPNATPEEAMAFLQGKMQSIKQQIQANPTVKLNDLSFK